MHYIGIPDVFDCRAFTATHLWYSRGKVLRRLCLATLADEQIRVFRCRIARIEANAKKCIVETETGRGFATLWVVGSNRPFVKRAGWWILTPNRVVYECQGNRIFSYDFHKAPSEAARGLLRGASDQRILYQYGSDNSRHRRWQDGSSAADIRSLETNDEEFRWTDPLPITQRRPYRLVIGSLVCESRTAARVRQLVKDPALAARVCKFL